MTKINYVVQLFIMEEELITTKIETDTLVEEAVKDDPSRETIQVDNVETLSKLGKAYLKEARTIDQLKLRKNGTVAQQSCFDNDGIHKLTGTKYNTAGVDKQGYNEAGWQIRTGRNKFTKTMYDENGLDMYGCDINGFNQDGFDKNGFGRDGVNRETGTLFDKRGFDKNGYSERGLNRFGQDREGYFSSGYNEVGYNREGYNRQGFNREGIHRETGTNYDAEGYDASGFDDTDVDRQGFDREGYDGGGFNRAGYDKDGYDEYGFNKFGFARDGYDKDGYDIYGFDRNGINRSGFNRDGIFTETGNLFDSSGFDKDGFDENGFNRDGKDKDGYDREGYKSQSILWRSHWYNKVLDRHGYDREGYDFRGFDIEGYDKKGRDQDGFDRFGFGKNGLHRDTGTKLDVNGFSILGVNESGVDRMTGKLNDNIAFATDYINAGSLTINRFASENGIDNKKAHKMIKTALIMMPELEGLLKETLDRSQKRVVAILINDTRRFNQDEIDLAEFWKNHPMMTIEVVKRIVPNDQSSKMEHRVLFNTNLTIDNVESIIHTFTPSSWDVSGAIGAINNQLSSINKQRTKWDEGVEATTTYRKLTEIKKFLLRYKDTNTSRMWKNNDRYSFDGGKTFIDITEDIVNEARDYLQNNGRLICCATVKDYIRNKHTNNTNANN